MPYKIKEERNTYQLKWHTEHKDSLRKQQKRYRWRVKVETLTHYAIDSKPKCIVCGESDIQVLTIDHINGEGSSHRKRLNRHGGWEFYVWLRKQGYPVGYQVLCMNCNWKKRCLEYNLYSEVQSA